MLSKFPIYATLALSLLASQALAQSQSSNNAISGSNSISINGSVGTLISTGSGAWISGIQHPSITDWTISAPNLPGGIQLLPNGAFAGGLWGLYIFGNPTSGFVGQVVVTITQAGSTGSATLTIDFNIVAAPSLSSQSFPATTVGRPVSGTISASGGTTPYSYAVTGGALPPGVSLSSGGTLSGSSSQAGSFNFTVTVTDAASQTASNSYSITINPAISFTSGTLSPTTVGASLNHSISATGGTGAIALSLGSGSLPPGINLSGNTLSGSFSTAGSYSFTILATDTVGATAQQSLSQLVNPPVSIQGDSLPGGWPTRSVSSTLSPVGGTAPFTFQLASGALPPGISLSAGGTMSGAFSAVGNYSFSVRVTDSVGSQDSRNFDVTVRPAMTVSPSGQLPPATVGAPFEIGLRAETQAGSVTFSIGAGTPPPGLTFNVNSISGIPTTVGSYSLGFQATTSDGETASGDFTLEVNPALQFTVPPAQSLYVGKPMTWTPTLAGGTPPLLVKLLGSSLPTGFTLNTATGEISGTPTAAGTLEFTLEATDANVARIQRYVTLPILVPVQITTNIEAVYPLSQPVSIPLTASSGTAPYTFQLASGTLPNGIQLDGARLVGTPDATGSFTFTLRATDAVGASVDRTYKVIIASGFTLSSSKLQFLVQPGQTSPVQTLKLDANPAGVPVTLATSASWLKSSINASGTPGAVDFWVELPPTADSGEFTTDVTFQSQGLPSQTVSVALRVFKASDAKLTADFISSGNGQHTVSLRAQLPEVPFEATLEGPGAVSYQLSAHSGAATNNGAFGLRISPSDNPAALSLETQLKLRNGLTGETLSFPIPTGDIPSILLSSTELNLIAAPDSTNPVDAEVLVRTQSGSRRYATTVDSPWLTVTPAEGALDPATTLSLRVNPSSLLPGENVGLVTVYLEDGRPAATMRVLVSVAPMEINPTVDQSAFVFRPSRTSASLQLRNPTSRALPFALRSSHPSIQVNLESGQLAAGESRTIQVSAQPFTDTQSLFVSFGDGAPIVIDTFWLAPQQNCEAKPSISWLAPSRGSSLPMGVSTKVQALLTDGCGNPLTQGSLSLLPDNGQARGLLHSSDGLWSTLWTATSGNTIELLYLSPDGLLQSRRILSVDVK